MDLNGGAYGQIGMDRDLITFYRQHLGQEVYISPPPDGDQSKQK